MRKQLLDRLDGPGSEQYSALLCLTVCFAVGSLGGCLFAGLLDGDAQARLFDYFSAYFTAMRENGVSRTSLPSTAWELARWPLLAFALGFTALGVVGLPIAFCARGFLFSYAVAVFVRLYGSAGFLAALAVFSITGLLALPVLFTLGVDAFRGAGALAGKLLGSSRRSFPPRQGRILRAGVCGALLVLGAALQSQLSSVLLETAMALLN